MGPAVDQLPRPLLAHDLGQRIVGLVGVALQEAAAVSGQELQRMLPPPAGGVVEQHDGRAGTAMAAIVGHDGPEVAALRGLPARIQHRRAGLVHEDPVGAAQMGLHVVDHRHQVEARAADPVAERAAVEMQPLSLEDPGLAVKRKVVAELRDDDPCDQPLGRQSARHDMLGRMRLRHGLRTAATGVSGAPRHQHLELRRDHVEPLGDVLADPGHLPTAARAEGAGGLDHALDPGQMRRQMPAVARGLARFIPSRPGKRRFGLLLRGREHALGQFGIFQRQVELVGRQLLGAFAERSRCEACAGCPPAGGWLPAPRPASPRPRPGGPSDERSRG
jgi:hypothetical protein